MLSSLGACYCYNQVIIILMMMIMMIMIMMMFNSLGVLLPNSAGLVNLTKEEQKNLVAQILTEVPLIDG